MNSRQSDQVLQIVAWEDWESWLVGPALSRRNTVSFSVGLIVLLTGFSFCLLAEWDELSELQRLLRRRCRGQVESNCRIHVRHHADALQRPLLLRWDCGWAAVFVGGCGSETRSSVMDRRSRKRPSDLEPHRGRERRAGGPFCCERSESPAGGAALSICQRSLRLFSVLRLQRMKKTREQKASQWHCWFTQHASGFQADSLLFFFHGRYTQKSLPDRYDYYKDAVHAAVLNMSLKLFKANFWNIFKTFKNEHFFCEETLN